MKQAPKSSGMDDKATQRMLNRLENEMTKGRQGGIPSDALDMMMSEISKASTDIVIERKKLFA